MKLLFDHNLSVRLVRRLNDLFPDSTHVYRVNYTARKTGTFGIMRAKMVSLSFQKILISVT